jgi:polyisoprenoid-binding protein YceI
MTNRLFAGLAGLCLLAAAPFAGAADFDFKDPKGVSTIVAEIDSLVEPVVAVGNGVTGAVAFDPAKPEATSGEIKLAVESLKVPHPMMTDHMQGENWLDKAKYPEIVFAIKTVTKVEAVSETRWKLMVDGELTLHGVTKPVSVEIHASYVKDGVAVRMRGEGDLLVLRAEFAVDRAEYGVNPTYNTDKIGKDIKLTVAIVGMSK